MFSFPKIGLTLTEEESDSDFLSPSSFDSQRPLSPDEPNSLAESFDLSTSTLILTTPLDDIPSLEITSVISSGSSVLDDDESLTWPTYDPSTIDTLLRTAGPVDFEFASPLSDDEYERVPSPDSYEYIFYSGLNGPDCAYETSDQDSEMWSSSDESSYNESDYESCEEGELYGDCKNRFLSKEKQEAGQL